MNITKAWIDTVEAIPSPNQDSRPIGEPVSVLVIHNISLPPNQFGGGHVRNFFANTLHIGHHPYFETIADLRVSSHLFIDRQGTIDQFVSFEDRAWHAGASCFEGRDGCNDFSIGIELEGTDIEPYTDAQYDTLCTVSVAIMAAYPEINVQRIVGHADISSGRKTDPGISFDWYRYLSGVREPKK